jgi:hypothetical protein
MRGVLGNLPPSKRTTLRNNEGSIHNPPSDSNANPMRIHNSGNAFLRLSSSSWFSPDLRRLFYHFSGEANLRTFWNFEKVLNFAFRVSKSAAHMSGLCAPTMSSARSILYGARTPHSLPPQASSSIRSEGCQQSDSQALQSTIWLSMRLELLIGKPFVA